jgi:condensin complex subunit 2
LTAGGPIPFNTQFFADDFDDDAPGFDAFGGDEPGAPGVIEEDLLSSAVPSRRVKPETVTYAKRAKRVDVRKLKNNIKDKLAIKEMASIGADEDDMVRL